MTPMEENKKDVKTEQSQNAGEQGQGGRKRRHRHKGRGHGGQNQNAQNGNKQKGKNQPKQNPNNNQGKQNNQPVQNKPQNQQQAQQQNQPSAKTQKPQKNQNGGGRDKTNEKNERKKDENRKDTYVYILDGNLYVNLTNKCCNGCDFCVRNERDSYYGNYLWLRHGDPTAEKVIAAVNGFGDLSRFKEVVFCGFGEPTYKMTEMLALCDYFHEKGLKTRLNTNGQGNLVNKRDITLDLKDKIDFVSISLNASCVEKYQPVCRSQYGEAGFAGILDFAKSCKRNGVDCRFTIVDCIGEEEVEACKRLAESLRVPLHVRKYIADC